MANTNSYFENMSQLTHAAEEMLNVANAFNETISGNKEGVVIEEDGEMVMPSYTNVIQRLERAENTIAKFTQGKGVVQADDGTYRRITVDNISHPAADITFDDVEISTFGIDPNWFFESFQFPRCVVRIDLAGKIDETSDRVYVSRLVIDSQQSAIDTDKRSAILTSNLSYNDMINYLEVNNISYKEDKDEVKLPLTYERYVGGFQVTGISLIQNMEGLTETWYYIDTINYALVDENGKVLNNDNVLKIGDYLRFDNSLFKITGIDQGEKRIKLEYNIGYETINTYDTLEFYNTPFSEKKINVGVSINEYDVIYIKGVNETFNVVSTNWSTPIVVDTNSLANENGTGETLFEYYITSVADFGKRMISDYKEGKTPAYGAPIPNAPVLSEDEVRVVQVNTQLEATLDSERYNNITTEISSTKSNITAVRTTIANNKDRLIQETNTSTREIIQNSINADTEKMNNLITQFSSLVEELNTLLTDAGAINYTPKYHIRGFFGIPDPKYLNPDKKTGKQTIIGFETVYRYLHMDETGTKLNSFDFTDSSNGLQATGVFTDWNLAVSSFLEKKYNPETDKYEWVDRKIDGTQIAINQIDIPIRNGEKVELKIRSISESGYPYNPVKSEWSNSIIVSFPDNLTTDDSVTTILETVKSDMTSVVLQETLSAAGIYTHIVDSNSMYKHDANNIQYTETEIDAETGTTTVKTMSVADKIKSLTDSIIRLSLSGDIQNIN
jgi:hypothetical protein